VNHFISGIIKIVLLEASAALLLLDLAAGPTRFAKARLQAAGALAGLMVFAWANYGALRTDSSLPYVLTAAVVVLLCAWLMKAGFGTERSAVMDSFRDTAKKLHATRGPGLVAVGLIAVLSVGWVGQGVRTNSIIMVHPWEQFHFYLGAKYQKQLGWFDIYKAAVLADRESVNVLAGLSTTRDLTTFDEVPIATALSDAARVRAKFSDQDWEAFKTDWTRFTRLFPINWSGVMSDHGNSNSPAWAIFAAPLAHLVPVSIEGNAWLGWLDMLLMLGLWLFIWHTFGHRVAATALLCWAMEPLVFDYLSGSFLRWDWLFATGLAACFLKRKQYAAAGAFFGYAVATKLFPIFFGVALAFRAFFEWRRTRTFSRDYWRFLIGATVAGGASVAIAAAMFGPSAWVEYAQRIQVAQVEKFYAIQYSLKTVFLQLAAGSPRIAAQTLWPAELMQARREVNIDDFAVGFMLVRLAFTLLIAQLARRADDVEAFTLGPLLVFTWLTVNMYYWNMLGLLALGLMLRRERQRPALAMLVGLHVIFMFFYLYQHLNRGLTEGYAVACLLCLLIIGGSVWEWLLRRQTTDYAATAPSA
jgi:Glycosyltransferase family 87